MQEGGIRDEHMDLVYLGKEQEIKNKKPQRKPHLEQYPSTGAGTTADRSSAVLLPSLISRE